jgi:hypothetical protein
MLNLKAADDSFPDPKSPDMTANQRVTGEHFAITPGIGLANLHALVLMQLHGL